MALTVRKPISALCFAAAALALLAVPLVLPPWAEFWRSDFAAKVPNDRLSFVYWAVGVSVFLAVLGLLAGRWRSAAADNVALLLVTLAAVVLVNWILLAHMPRSIYVHDIRTNHRYRPNAVQSWPKALGGKTIRINAYGYHDDWFPMEKTPGEFRAVMLGDSVTMGHGVTSDETFSNQLEDLIDVARPGTCPTSQVINTGVGGFAIHQEYAMFEEALAFRPDFAALGFVLNDASVPFVTDRRFGGTGVDYNGMAQAGSELTGYLLNETGFGRLARSVTRPDLTMKQAWRYEIFNARRVAMEALTNPQIREAWEVVLQDLARVYGLARRERIPFLLLIFPFTFQLLDEDSKAPQAMLKRHAAEHGVDVIDFLETFERVIFEGTAVREPLAAGRSAEEIRKSHAEAIGRYFLDEDHLTPEGHRVVAKALFDYLQAKGLIDRAAARC